MELPDTHKLILPKLKSRIAQRIFQSDKIDTIMIIYPQIVEASLSNFRQLSEGFSYTMFEKLEQNFSISPRYVH